MSNLNMIVDLDGCGTWCTLDLCNLVLLTDDQLDKLCEKEEWPPEGEYVQVSPPDFKNIIRLYIHSILGKIEIK